MKKSFWGKSAKQLGKSKELCSSLQAPLCHCLPAQGEVQGPTWLSLLGGTSSRSEREVMASLFPQDSAGLAAVALILDAEKNLWSSRQVWITRKVENWWGEHQSVWWIGWSRTAGDRYADARLAGKEDGPFTTDGWRCSIIPGTSTAATHGPVCSSLACRAWPPAPRGSLHWPHTKAGPRGVTANSVWGRSPSKQAGLSGTSY